MLTPVLCAAIACTLPPAGGDENAVHVTEDSLAACVNSSSVLRDYAWTFDGAAYRLGDRMLTPERLAEIRRIALEGPVGTEGLLEAVGVTREAFERNREALLAAARPHDWDGQWPVRLPDGLEHIATFDAIDHRIETHALGGYRMSLGHSLQFGVELPGDPPIRVESRTNSDSLWMLPWTVTVGGRSWTTHDVRLARSMHELSAPGGPCEHLLAGDAYWHDAFWRDGRFWRPWLGRAIAAALRGPGFARLAGWIDADELFWIGEAKIPPAGLPPSLSLVLAAHRPKPLDGAEWHDPLDGDRPVHDWPVFLATWRAATSAAQRLPWLAEWRGAKPGRAVRLETFGDRGHAQPDPALALEPAWRDAGLAGEPLELDLMQGDSVRGTLFVSTADGRALVLRMQPADGAVENELDRLEVAFAPDRPTYALVEPDGRVALRTIGR